MSLNLLSFLATTQQNYFHYGVFNVSDVIVIIFIHVNFLFISYGWCTNQHNYGHNINRI